MTKETPIPNAAELQPVVGQVSNLPGMDRQVGNLPHNLSAGSGHSAFGHSFVIRHSAFVISVLALAMAYPTFLSWVYFVVVAKPTDGPAQANPAMQITYTAGKALQFLLPVLCVLLWERRWPRPAAPNFRGLLFGVGFGLAVGAAILALFHLWLVHSPLLCDTPARLRAKVAEFGMATPLGYFVLAGFISIVHSLLEEYYWRWFVFGNLRQLIPVGAAILVSSLAFMAHHVVVLAVYLPGQFWTAAVPLSLCIAAGGAVWAWLYQRTGTIYSAWVSHMLIDGAIMAVGYQLLFGAGR